MSKWSLYIILSLCLLLPDMVDCQQDSIETFNLKEIEELSEDYPIAIDSTTIREASFDEEELRKLRESSEYNYDLDPKYEDDYFTRLLTRFFNWIEKWFPERETQRKIGPVLKFVLVLLAIFAIAFAIAKSKLSWIFKKKVKESEIVLEEVDIDIKEDTLKKLLEQALKSKDYRLAIRYEFIILLKSLEEEELINWQKSKTNYEYIDEIEESSLRHQFRESVTIFEHVWYGDFEVESESQYQRLSNVFRSVKLPVA